MISNNFFTRGSEFIRIAHVYKAKKPVLIVGNDKAERKVASFVDDTSAEIFYEMLRKWLYIEG